MTESECRDAIRRELEAAERHLRVALNHADHPSVRMGTRFETREALSTCEKALEVTRTEILNPPRRSR